MPQTHRSRRRGIRPRGPIAPAAVAFIVLLLAGTAPGEPGDTPIHHRLEVAVDPAAGSIDAIDTITGELLGDSTGDSQVDTVSFTLHGGLTVELVGEGWTLAAAPPPDRTGDGFGINEPGEAPPLERRGYTATRVGDGPLRVLYSGAITHAIEREGEEYARSFSSTAGIVSEEGVYLGAAAAWVPEVVVPEGAHGFITYELTVSLPAGWDAVSQGTRTAHERTDAGTTVTWDIPTPTEEVHLLAGRYHEYTRPAGAIEAQVFLREDDPALAAQYLEVTAQYVQMFGQLIGPYPYEKFALVENFWETGYGMPSFTLLGPRVIRFPFILHSSYPHEILHNWWGNSVYVDYERGNWCEGLTAYLADHLVKEGRGQGEEYRRDTLKKFANYVSEGREITLAEFRSRHSGATEAVGYGKSLMLWHMLRRDLGDETFARALQRLYRRHIYDAISFGEIEAIFSETAGRDLAPVFAQWVERRGAPQLSLRVLEPSEGHADWSIVLAQTQEDEPYHLRVPVAVLYEGSSAPQMFTVELVGLDGGPAPRRLSVALSGGQRPVWVAVDPAFDLFRRLDREEIPPSIGEIFGAERAVVVLPSDATEPDWAATVVAWDPDGGQFELVGEDEIDALPTGRPVWVLGRQNRWAAPIAESARARGTDIGPEKLRFGAESVPSADHAFVVVDRHPADADTTVGWIASDREDALPGLARKLPHYGKYSYLAFSGSEPTNVVKGQWGSERSPLAWRAEGFDGSAPTLPAREPLARLAPVFDPGAMLEHVAALADPALEGRAAGSPGAHAAAERIAAAFAAMGLEPGGADGGWFDTWTEEGPDGPLELRNVIAVLPGAREDWSGTSVVVGAHYDHLGRGWPDVRSGNEGKIHPGADDNASGVAVLLEVAKLLAGGPTSDRSLVFVAFDGEEWGRRGSIRYVAHEETRPAKDALAMISLDAVGRLGDGKLLVLGTGTATEWIHIARGIGFTTGVESTAVADDPGGSDQVSFHEIGVPAVQLTTGPHEDYHRPSDTPDRIDAGGMVKVATWLREAVVYLGERDTPLTSTLGDGSAPVPASSGRRVSLGTVPDFAFPGPGVRVDSVLPDSPAAGAGIQGGDRIVRIDGADIADLRAYSDVLKSHGPGDTIEIELERDGGTVTVRATLVAR